MAVERDCQSLAVERCHELQPSQAALARLAAVQHGVFSRTDARDVGVTKRQLEYGTQIGRFERLDRGVYRIVGAPASWRQQVVASVLTVGPNAVASNATAAHLHGLILGEPKHIEVTDHRSRRARHRNAIVHQCRDLFPHHVAVMDGIPLTNAQRTVVDLAATWPRVTGEALDRGKRLGLYDWAEVARVVIDVARQGRTGVVLMRDLLVQRTDHLGRTESELEDAFLLRLGKAGIELPEAQVEIFDNDNEFVCRADFGYLASKTLIELDGLQWHGDPAATKADRTKQNRLVALGFQVYRYTWWHCRFDYLQMLDDMRTASAPPVLAAVRPI